MKRPRFTDQQIAFALKQADSGVPVEEVCRKLGTTWQTQTKSDQPPPVAGIDQVKCEL